MRPQPDPAAPEQESVWSYPRPAIAERTAAHLTIVHRGVTIVNIQSSVRTLETSHPPSYYIAPADIRTDLLRRSDRRSLCEWKGEAVYWDVVMDGQRLADVAWSYPRPSPAFEMLRDHLAFYAGPFDRCTVDGETVVAQPGGFYGGWITSTVAGPFKGGPGSRFW